MTMTNIKQKRHGANNYTWESLTEGKLRCLYRLANDAAKNGNLLAHDCAHDLYNFFDEHGLAESLDPVA